MTLSINKEGKLIELEEPTFEAKSVFDAEEYLYKIFNNTAQVLGEDPDMSLPENIALAKSLAETANSLAALDTRTKAYRDEYNASVAYKKTETENKNREPVGFKKTQKQKVFKEKVKKDIPGVLTLVPKDAPSVAA